MLPIRLHMHGSDPEFVFARIEDYDPVLIPATQIITNNRARGLNSFIGTDGHASTAELRPPPAHNIRRHLYDIAVALDAVDARLEERSKNDKVKLSMIATPMVSGEPLGGHIHTSFFVNHAGMAHAKRINYIYSSAGWDQVDSNIPPTSLSELDRKVLREVERESRDGLLPTIPNFATAMHYLVQTFEKWVQPSTRRSQRNQRYGGERDGIRWMPTKPPAMPKYSDHAYFHLEYRVPSTWLVHPWLAYAYFALSKLTVLNFPRVYELAINTPTMMEYASTDDARDAFLKRLALVTDGGKQTRDLYDLGNVLTFIGQNRLTWCIPGRSIDIGAWKELLG